MKAVIIMSGTTYSEGLIENCTAGHFSVTFQISN